MKKLDFLKVSFIIRTDRIQNNESPVYMMLFLDGRRAYIATGQKVSLKNWDEKNGRFSGNNSNINAMNEFIDRMKYDVIRIYNELKSKDSDITVDVLRQRLKGDGEKKSKKLLEVFQIYNNNFEKLIDIEIKKDTFRRYALDFLLPKL
ncbi:MAG: hypothetical protein KA341_01625 [Saprospiraceae bacterium]|nr:hypothetical protein [Saprospiraceae bacterium]